MYQRRIIGAMQNCLLEFKYAWPSVVILAYLTAILAPLTLVAAEPGYIIQAYRYTFRPTTQRRQQELMPRPTRTTHIPQNLCLECMNLVGTMDVGNLRKLQINFSTSENSANIYRDPLFGSRHILCRPPYYALDTGMCTVTHYQAIT